MSYADEVEKLVPGAYAIGTSRQVWIQNREHLCISKAISIEKEGAQASELAWKSAYENAKGTR